MISLVWFAHNRFGNDPPEKWNAVMRLPQAIVPGTVNNHVSIKPYPHLGKVVRGYGTKVLVMKSVLSATFNIGR